MYAHEQYGVRRSRILSYLPLVYSCGYRDLAHPNIVRLLAYSMSEAEVVLVMNFVKGTDLERVLFSKKYAKEVSHCYNNSKL